MAFRTDTIAAISTGLSDSGIEIVRVSGEDAIEIADRIFRSPKGKKKLAGVKGNTVHYGFIYDGDELVDEVMAVVLKAPHSYTTEDTVEINCHGGVLMVQKVLDTVLKAGARMAEPGEFTKRAFLNGRIDLSRAEAVIDVIHSQNEYALRAGTKQLRGNLYEAVSGMRKKLLYEIAFIESALDDPEHISLDEFYERITELCGDLIGELEKLIQSADSGKLMKEGIRTVILGKPNAGKSSLMNLIVGSEKAIVTSVAGTTRDVLEENIRIHGLGLNIVDTAGIHETEDIVEKIGVERALSCAEDADLIVYVVDSSTKLDESDYEIIDFIRDKKVIILLNKSDLEAETEEENLKAILRERLGDEETENLIMIKTSAKEGSGLDAFEDAVRNLFFQGKLSMDNEIVITNLRHKEALMDVCGSLKLVLKAAEDGMPEDFLSIDLMNAYTSLGYIIGEEVGDDLIEEIFSKFCMGK
ncbi:MAG: tRNA uridine-5-carboxymethylaminomethyl(34) synthesis GTPase MnmE [Lachnospiraceae bacterium]|nr:tRNA uridine-5-carboxymethylaminomethyl(34) synthesis GTPase MnmE [Lachnospiraceae bacterium]